MKQLLTINIEGYYQVGAFSHLIPCREWERFEDRVRRNTDSALQLLEECSATATFFVSGWIAEKHPDLLRQSRREANQARRNNGNAIRISIWVRWNAAAEA